MTEHIFDKYFRKGVKQIFCPGCGNGIVFQAVARAIEESGLDHDKVVIITGVGCSSRASIFMDSCGLHCNHGRSLAFAAGVKMANPDLHVFVVAGDGDAVAIGGNHFIHSCRRNLDLNLIVCNNQNYGMTGGQFSPTTPLGAVTKTTMYIGNIDPEFDICQLAIGSGATYVARSTTYHINDLIKQIKGGIMHRGFSVVDAMCDCPSLYGRLNGLGNAAQMMARRKDQCVTIEKAKNMTKEELAGKLIIGKFYEDNDKPEYTAQYAAVVAAAKEVA